MRLTIISILLFIFHSQIFSQEIIKNAKVIFKNKAELKGDYFFYFNKPDIFTLIDSSGNPIIFQISSVDKIVGSTFLLKNINSDGKDKLFICIVEGPELSLYKSYDLNFLQFYVLKDSNLVLLQGGKKEFQNKLGRYVKEDNTYKGVLKYLMKDNGYVVKEIDRINFSEKDLSEIVVSYNKGQITYYNRSDLIKLYRKTNWKIYAQYSSRKSDIYLNSLYQIGGSIDLSENSKHSFKYGLEYAKLSDVNSHEANYLNISISYLYDLYRLPSFDFYIGVRIADIGFYWNEKENELQFVPRVSPSVGINYHINNKIEFYFEVNHILLLEDIPHNLTGGLMIDI